MLQAIGFVLLIDDWIEPNSIEKILNINDDRETDCIIARSFINRNGQAKIERYPL